MGQFECNAILKGSELIAVGERCDTHGTRSDRDATFDWTIQLNAQTREHSLLQKETDRELNNRGEVKKETVKTFEVFPIANRAPILRSKLVRVVWIDPADKQVMRLEARLAEGFTALGSVIDFSRPFRAARRQRRRITKRLSCAAFLE